MKVVPIIKAAEKLKLHEAKACGVYSFILRLAVDTKLKHHDAKACGV